jgi:hypothetical protein
MTQPASRNTPRASQSTPQTTYIVIAHAHATTQIRTPAVVNVTPPPYFRFSFNVAFVPLASGRHLCLCSSHAGVSPTLLPSSSNAKARSPILGSRVQLVLFLSFAFSLVAPARPEVRTPGILSASLNLQFVPLRLSCVTPDRRKAFRTIDLDYRNYAIMTENGDERRVQGRIRSA